MSWRPWRRLAEVNGDSQLMDTIENRLNGLCGGAILALSEWRRLSKTAKGVGYVSAWVLIWGTASSLVDYILLEREIYGPFSIGQAFTFAGYGLAAAVLAVKVAPRFLKPEEPQQGG